MSKNVYLLIIALAINIASFSQIKNGDVLFSVNDQKVLASEFLRVYNKNLNLVQDETQKDVDQYLKLFINYKLKLAEAKSLKFDKKLTYIKELNGYKKQLSKKYLTENKVTEALVKEAYNRISFDINARHILVRTNEFEKDTIAAYNKIVGFRNRLINEDFDKVKSSLHNGTTVFVEDLGYFSGFKMVYEFENVAYNTAVGDVSEPFRTQFGFHVVQVLDKRKSRGEVTVGHIMVSNKQKDSTSVSESRINEIYKMILQGQEFESLATQFSDDKSSAKNGGKLKAFKSGQLSSVKFEDTAFSLQENGDISAPFQSNYGWHIIKLYDKKPLKPLIDLQSELEQRIKRDSRSKLINSAMSKTLRQLYNIESSNIDLSYFQQLIDEAFLSNSSSIPESFDGKKELIKIGNKVFTYLDFAEFLKVNQKENLLKKSTEDPIRIQFDAFIDKNILIYHEENLELVNQDFANILNEYREGLLLFDLMENKIWNTVKNDTVSIQNYYAANMDKYVNKERIDAVVVTSAKKEYIKSVKKALESGESLDNIEKGVNIEQQQNIIITSGLMSKEASLLPTNLIIKKGVSEIYKFNKAFHVILIIDILPESVRPFEEVRGLVTSDYQLIYEDNWLKELSNKYKVRINQDVLDRIKSKITN